MFYINNTEKALNKTFYYKSDLEPYNPELTIKYINKKLNSSITKQKLLVLLSLLYHRII
jgi:hypothetical protein